jgi:hypothetical protein
VSAPDRTEQALAEALEERNRLWEELQRQRALEADLAYWRARAEDIERSSWWRLGKPLRLAKRLLANPADTLEDLSYGIRDRRRGR